MKKECTLTPDEKAAMEHMARKLQETIEDNGWAGDVSRHLSDRSVLVPSQITIAKDNVGGMVRISETISVDYTRETWERLCKSLSSAGSRNPTE